MKNAANLIETSCANLYFDNGIVTITIKENANIELSEMKEIIEKRNKLVGINKFSVLIDSSSNHSTTNESQKYLAELNNPNWICMAVLTNNLASKILANFFIKINKPIVKTKMFTKIEAAIEWIETFKPY